MKNVEIVKRMVEIMEDPERLNSPEDFKFVANNAQPMVEILKEAVLKYMISNGIEETKAKACILPLVQMATMAGGISFVDFSITEKLAEEMGRDDQEE